MNTRRNFTLGLLGGAAAAATRAHAQATSEVPLGTVAGHAIGRAIISVDGSLEMIAYYPFFAGLALSNTALLAAGNTEKNAFFTLRTARCVVNPISNGVVHYSRLTPVDGSGELISRIVYHPSPNLDFNRPETFSDGQTIVTLRGRAGSLVLVEGATITYHSTAEVVTSEDFSFQGRTMNLRDTKVTAYTVTLTGPAPSLADLRRLDSPLLIPLAGAFVAVGNKSE